jgi:hypothetical protein
MRTLHVTFRRVQRNPPKLLNKHMFGVPNPPRAPPPPPPPDGIVVR